MPKVVDHDVRRTEIIDAAWRVIIRDGLDATTMAAIAHEAGYANGALKPYFAGKHDLLVAAFEHIYTRTTERISAATNGLAGIDALRACCAEIMPLTDPALDEAHVIIPFWNHALTDSDLAQLHLAAINDWRAQLRRHVRAARQSGAIATSVPDKALAELILTMLHGSQVTATLSPTTRTELTRQLDDLIALITTGGR